MSNFNDFRSGIKSIQRGTVTINGTYTVPYSTTASISAVVLANSIVIVSNNSSGAGQELSCVRGHLSDTDELTISIGVQNTNSTQVVKWQVVEFQSQYWGAQIKSIQAGLLTTTVNETVHTASVSAVVMAKSVLYMSQHNSEFASTNLLCNGELTDVDELTFTQGASHPSYTTNVAWQLVEYY